MKFNLHTHTTYSDGRLSPEEVVQAALAGGLTHVAITDHFESTKLSSRQVVTPRRFGGYVDHLRELAAAYAGRIEVLAGIEIDLCQRRTDFRTITGKPRQRVDWDRLDLVYLEYVGDVARDGEDLQTLMNLRPCFSCPVGLAHSNLAEAFAMYKPADVIAGLESTVVFVELCCSKTRNLVIQAGEDGARGSLDELAFARQRLGLARAERGPGPAAPEFDAEISALEREVADLEERTNAVPFYRWDVPFNREFYDLVRDSQVCLAIGTDAHSSPEQVMDVEDAVAFVREHRLEDRLLTRHLPPRVTE